MYIIISVQQRGAISQSVHANISMNELKRPAD